MAIPLDTLGDCPACARPLLSLAEDRCRYCQADLEGVLPKLPTLRSRLEALAPGWSPERLSEWLRPRPLDLAWAQQTGHWRNLSAFVATELWKGWANGLASLRGRGQERSAGILRVESATLCGIGQEASWVKARLRLRLDGDDADPLREIWTLTPTGESRVEPRCSACGGSFSIQTTACPYCASPAVFSPGPWLLRAIHSEAGPGAGGPPSPFEGGSAWGI